MNKTKLCVFQKMLQPKEMVKPHLAHLPKYLLAGTDLHAPDKLRANKIFANIFNDMTPQIKEKIRKKKLRLKMKGNPVLRKKVWAKRKWNLKHRNKTSQDFEDFYAGKTKQNPFNLINQANNPEDNLPVMSHFFFFFEIVFCWRVWSEQNT